MATLLRLLVGVMQAGPRRGRGGGATQLVAGGLAGEGGGGLGGREDPPRPWSSQGPQETTRGQQRAVGVQVEEVQVVGSPRQHGGEVGGGRRPIRPLAPEVHPADRLQQALQSRSNSQSTGCVGCFASR
jgi:hypothetical protein